MDKINYAGKYIFLGGSCKDTNWREQLKPLLADRYFDPVVPDDEWDDDKLNEEQQARRYECSHWVYVISSKNPGLLGVAQMVESIILNTTTSYICFLEEDGQPFAEDVAQSIQGLRELVGHYTKHISSSINELADQINKSR